METFILTCNLVLPLFLVMLAGQICRNIHLVKDADISGMNKLTFHVFLPFSIVKSILQIDDASFGISGGFVAFSVFYLISVFALSTLIIPRFFHNPSLQGVLVQNMFRSNYTLFGLALAEALYPQGDGGAAAALVAITAILFNVLAVLTFELTGKGKWQMTSVVKKTSRNPLIWACAIGMFLKFLPFDLPEVIVSGCSKLGGIAVPFALFMIGASINIKHASTNMNAFMAGIFGRLVIVPVIYLTLACMLGFRGPMLAALICAIASPTAVSSYPMAAEMGGDKSLAAQLVAFSAIFSAVTIFIIVYLSKHLGFL